MKSRIDIEILYEDEALLVVNKAPKMLIIPDRWDAGKPNLLSQVQYRYPNQKIYVVHRLDEGTSGVVLFAKTPEAHRHLGTQFEDRRIVKTYLAIVRGEVRENGTIELSIGPDLRRKGLMAVRKGEKESITDFRVAERFRCATFLEVMPRTGRTHQIRVHLKAFGYPLLVDPDYGGASAVFLSEFKTGYKSKPDEPERPLIDRLTLHAGGLRFTHPVSGELMSMSADLPKDMRGLLNALRKYRRRHCE